MKYEFPKDFLCIDFETTGLDFTKDKPHGIGVGRPGMKSGYYPMWEIPTWIKDALADPKLPKLGQKLHGFDAKFAQKNGLTIRGDFHDTKILAHLIDPDQDDGLKQLSEKYLGIDSLVNKRELDRYLSLNNCGHVGHLCAKDLLDATHPHLSIIAKYCEEDVDNTMALFYLFQKKLFEMDKVLKAPPFNFKKSPLDCYFEEDMPLEYVLFDIEYRGIRIDLNAINTARENAVARMKEIENKLNHTFSKRIVIVEKDLYTNAIRKLKPKARKKPLEHEGKCKFSWSNNNHVGMLFYMYCDLPSGLIQTTSKGAFKTDKEAFVNLRENTDLPKLFRDSIALFAEYKLHAKIASTYTGTAKKGILSKVRIDEHGVPRIHPEYRQTTGTGRLACKNPNMQNIKRDSEIKKFFIPDNDDEVFDDADYSQIELRTGAHMSQDANLVGAYRDGIDLHLLTASRIFGTEVTKAECDNYKRQTGKRLNFLTIFDGKEYRAQQAIKADSGVEFTIEECKEFIRLWFELYPDVRVYLDEQKKFFQKYKFCIAETGRIRRLPDIQFGKDIKWFKDEMYGKWVPKYVGPNRQQLIDELLKDGKKVSESAIGSRARKHFDHALKAGYNQPIQGLAASMTKRAMIALHAAGRVISNQVHDSLVVSRKRGDIKAKQQVIDIMENTYKLSVPVKVDCKTLVSFHPNDKVKE